MVRARHGQREHRGDPREQAGLIPLHRERVVTTAFARQVSGGGVLGVRGIPRDHHAGQVHTLDQRRNLARPPGATVFRTVLPSMATPISP
jgi:hypothetical protein